VNGAAGLVGNCSVRAQHEESRGARPLRSVAEQGRRGVFRSTAADGYGPPQRGYSPSNRVRALSQ